MRVDSTVHAILYLEINKKEVEQVFKNATITHVYSGTSE